MTYDPKALNDALNKYRPNPKELTYKFFNRGVEEGPSCEKKPCDQWFVDALLTDLRKYSLRLVIQLTESEYLSPDSELSADAIMTAKNLFCVMRECRRLRSSPDLFPSIESREKFFEMVAYISGLMLKFRNDLSKTTNPLQDVRVASLWGSLKWTHRYMSQPSCPLPEKWVGIVPYWHSLNVATNIWNKWLDNRCRFHIPSLGNRILQRLPPNGMKIVNRLHFMYRIVEQSYMQANRITRVVPKNRRELSAASGEIHELPRSLVASRFEVLGGINRTSMGITMRDEEDGIISLEMISDIINALFKEEQEEGTDQAIIAVYLRN